MKISRRHLLIGAAVVTGTLVIAIAVATRSTSEATGRAETSTTAIPRSSTRARSESTTTRPRATTTTRTTAKVTTTTFDPTPPSTTPDTRDTPPVVRSPIACTATGAPTTGTVPSDDPTPSGHWVTAGQLSGNCDNRSRVFHLDGIDTRITWRSDTSEFVVWVVDARGGLDVAGGFADVECSTRCADQRTVTLQAGDYYLQVQASNAPWQVAVQEYRRE